MAEEVEVTKPPNAEAEVTIGLTTPAVEVADPVAVELMDCATVVELEDAVEPPKARGATLEAVVEDPKSSFTATEEAAVVFNPNPREGVDDAAVVVVVIA